MELTRTQYQYVGTGENARPDVSVGAKERARGFRHRVMRHFLRGELVPLSLAIPSLPRSVQAPGAERALVDGARAPQRRAPLDGATTTANALTAITAAAEAKLDAAAGAEREAVGGRRQEAPRRRFLNLEPGL